MIREFQVVNAGGNAEFGRASSGIVNILTRSGSNNWHGRGYGFLRNQRLDARHSLAVSKDPLTQAQYGASAGGPIRSDRDFLFISQLSSRPAETQPDSLPLRLRNVTQINSALDAFNYPGPRASTGEYPTGWDTSNGFVRTDHHFTDNQQLTLRYSVYDIQSDNARGLGGLNDTSRATRLDDRDHSIAATHIATPSPHDLIETRFQFLRSRLLAPGNDEIGPAVNIAGVANFGASTSSPTRRDADTYEASLTG